MSLFNAILNILKKKEPTKEDLISEGVCPNCWGRSEYGGKFYEAVKQNNFDVNSASPDVGWIQDYANKHLTGIALHEHEGELVCNKCKVAYKST